MITTDWTAAATLQARDDSGSELDYTFTVLRKGSLGELVRAVAGMQADERSRVVIEVAGGKSLNVAEILALAAQENLP